MNPSEKQKKTGKRLLCVLSAILLTIGALCFFSADWYVRIYGNTGFDSIIFTLTGGLNGVQSDLVTSFLLGGFLPAVLCIAVLQLLLFFPENDFRLELPLLGKKRQLFPLPRWLSAVLAVVICFSMIVAAGNKVGLFTYLRNINSVGQIYEQEYKDPKDVQITFPEEKRNLVYIMLESMETSYLSEDLGGARPYNLIPELYDLATENTNFSHSSGIGGLVEVPGASWTIGSMVAQTSGIPLRVPQGIDDWQNGYGKDGVFLPGVTSLTSILAENGYYQALMVGSDASFGGRRTYYNTHGVDRIYDIYTARQDDIVPKNYFVWWGMEDKHLFSYAKQELLKMAEMDQPFAFTMLTVDTHHIGGYNCDLCDDTYEETYENAIACSSRQVLEFVQWLQAQDFYENTTVIIAGDHFSMDREYFSRNVDEDYVRHGYNCFINSAVSTNRVKNRQFSALDMFPTTLAAMGCTIEGNRLGLGTNLFAGIPTLIEKRGYAAFWNELSMSSEYYQRFYETAE